MIYAMMNEDGTINTFSVAEGVTWRGMLLVKIAECTPEQRRQWGIYDYIADHTELGANQYFAPPSYAIDHDAGTVTEVRAILNYTSEEIAAQQADRLAKFREIRNQMLADSDWTQLADVPLTSEEKKAWAVTRQELRDAPVEFAKKEPQGAVSPNLIMTVLDRESWE